MNVPMRDRFGGIAVVDGRVILYGSAPSPEYPSTSSTCSFAVVDPSTLALSDVRHGSCADPALFGRSVIPAILIDKQLPAKVGGPSMVVRIAHLTARPPGWVLGPIVMTFPAFAAGETYPAWIYGDGDLWLYDWVNHFNLLRISARTGAVLQHLRIPTIWKQPLLAFNDDGLWIAPTGEASGPLYRLTPGATNVSAVFHTGSGGFAWWLLASGHSVWLDAQPRPVSRPSTIWELHGPNATALWHEAASPILDSEVDRVTGPSGMVGDNADGLWTDAVRASGAQQVIRIDPSTGRLAIEATLPPNPLDLTNPLEGVGPLTEPVQTLQAATLNRSLFLPEEPSGGTANPSLTAICRITPGST